jgi:PleD family two-component response regulator
MLERADKAMYQAKQHGRNWVMVSEQEEEELV